MENQSGVNGKKKKKCVQTEEKTHDDGISLQTICIPGVWKVFTVKWNGLDELRWCEGWLDIHIHMYEANALNHDRYESRFNVDNENLAILWINEF